MPSFDITSETDMAEVDNALANVAREIAQRFDFKGAACSVTREDQALTVLADDDLKLKQVHELLKGHLTRRGVDARVMDFKNVEKASGNSVRQVVAIRQGIDAEMARKIVKDVKGSKLKVQVAIQGDQLRVTGKKRDDLQAAIAHIKAMKVDVPLQYTNFRD